MAGTWDQTGVEQLKWQQLFAATRCVVLITGRVRDVKLKEPSLLCALCCQQNPEPEVREGVKLSVQTSL